MSVLTPEPGTKNARLTLLVGGIVGAAFGIAILVWPTKAAVAVAGLIAIYAIIAGLVNIAMAIFSRELGVGGRIGHALLGILYVLGGIYAFTELHRSAAFLAVFLVIMIGVMWVIEGFVALFAVGQSGNKVLTIVFAIISIIAGASLLSSPLLSAVFLWWLLAISLLVLGILNIIRAIFGRRALFAPRSKSEQQQP